jgi:polysaccharide export outer membrane protein
MNCFRMSVVLVLVLAVAPRVRAQAVKAQDARVSTAASATAGAADSGVVPGNRNPRYSIRRGDSFEVEFAYTPELNQMVVVQPDGYISLREVGTITAEGQTVPELERTIVAAYSKILHDAVVSISLKDFDRPHVIVGGQVAKPGQYELRSDITVSQALQLAGGFTEEAKHSQVILFRPVSKDMVEAKLIDVKKMMKSRNVNEDIHVQNGDTIFVPQNAISKIRRYLPSQSVGLAVNTLQY